MARKEDWRGIVKIQLGQSDGGATCLVYDKVYKESERPKVFMVGEHQGIFFHGETPRDVKKLMRGRPKAFYYARLENGRLGFDDPAPWQDW